MARRSAAARGRAVASSGHVRAHAHNASEARARGRDPWVRLHVRGRARDDGGDRARGLRRRLRARAVEPRSRDSARDVSVSGRSRLNGLDALGCDGRARRRDGRPRDCARQ